jgi:AraC family transcriptional regulator
MNYSDNKTIELWKSFMPLRNEIKNKVSSDLISLQVYDKMPDFINFDKETVFEKWAAIEVSEFNSVPDGMDSFVLSGGQYAVFYYKGLSTDTEIFRYIFGIWLPGSGFELDDRPHFEVLGEKYKNNDPDSEEEIWIPIKAKNGNH